MLVDPRSESPDISEGGLWAGTSLSSKFGCHVGFFVLQCANLTMVRNTFHTLDQKASSPERSQHSQSLNRSGDDDHRKFGRILQVV